MLKKILKRTLLAVSFLLLAAVTTISGIILWELPPKPEREYMALRWEWDQANGQQKSKEQWAEQDGRYLNRCIELADKYPNTTGELAALLMADDRAHHSTMREQIITRLRSRIENAKFAELVRVSGYGLPTSMSSDVAAPAIYDRIKQNLDQPMAPYVLARVCGAIGSGSESQTPPALFSETADLLVEKFVANPHIANFCGCLGNGSFSPLWAPQFEGHVRKILDRNDDRFVKLMASMALADIASLCEDRQAEAEQRYQAILHDFDGATPYHAQGVEQLYRHIAEVRLESLQFAPIGKPAPEIAGIDLDGKPMALSEYRGKVVVVSFWATWCSPCMKLIPHERELAEKFAGESFAIVGVNADDDPAIAARAAAERSVTTRQQ